MKRTPQMIRMTLCNKYPVLQPLAGKIDETYQALCACYENGGKVLVCGNGGSAADADHIVGELMKGFLLARELPTEKKVLLQALGKNGEYLATHLQGALPTLSLSGTGALHTAFANDVAPDMVFAQQVYGYGRPGDVLVALSTSGNSANVVNAARVAKVFGLGTLAVTGADGGQLLGVCDRCLCLPARATPDVQELTLPVYHALCAMLEARFFT